MVSLIAHFVAFCIADIEEETVRPVDDCNHTLIARSDMDFALKFHFQVDQAATKELLVFLFFLDNFLRLVEGLILNDFGRIRFFF